MDIENLDRLFDTPLAFFSPGPMELAIIAGIILLLFGGAKLPSLMRNLGRSTNEFRRGMRETSVDENDTSDSNTKSSEDA